MTETSHAVKTINGHDSAPSSLLQTVPVDFPSHHHAGAAPEQEQDDDGQISCICGYFDDDGWTVACDSCNKWQHQLCYYPQYENRSLPESLSHFCVDCRPQGDIDVQRARARQRDRREEQRLLVNGVKRQPAKSHKKKVKDVPYTNGWPLDKARHDRNSASPRDQPPPAKRPKTSHRTSDPITTTSSTKGHARRRTVTGINHHRSLSSSPDTPIDLYSEEFMQCYRNDNWAVTNANLHDSIAIANALSDWLNASEEDFREMHGEKKGDVLNRWDSDLDDIPGKAQLEISEAHDDRIRDEENNPPMWKTVTVKESVAKGGYIGELKGHVGFKDEYQADPTSRWSLLRHPEPFVFFHPRLPIYIDARNEGTELRFVRRSCQPNAKLQVLVTGGTTYHFCFMATEQIDPGMEIAVHWDTTESLPDLTRRGENSFSQKDMNQLSSWVSTVLANCGPCACQSYETECLMARFDRRAEVLDHEDDAPSIKAPKSKKRKNGQHMSPLNTTNFNSRSGSEARKVDLEDEGSDSRSASGSAGRGSASRDITPNTHYSHTGSNIPELSERERKKLAKEEEMFRRQEEEQGARQGKKKRNSGGSSLNTPSATSSRPLVFPPKYADAGTLRQTGLPSAKLSRKAKGSSTPKTPVKTVYKVVKRPPPDYVHSEVQCDMDKEEAEKRAQQSPPRRPFMSLTQRLLRRCAMNNARRRGSEVDKSPCGGEAMDVDPSPPSPRLDTRGLEQTLKSEPVTDTEMAGIETAQWKMSASETETDQAGQPPSTMPPHLGSDVPSSLPKEPAVSPWPSQSAHSVQPSTDSHPGHAKPDMHLHMAPPSTNPFAHPPPLSGAPAGSLTQSPAALTGPSIFSPSVTAAVTPSPAKKKMSLSDYTKRNKVKDKEVEPKTERDSSPASVASGPIVPPLQASDSAKLAAEGSAVVEDDVRMEDVVEGGAAPAV